MFKKIFLCLSFLVLISCGSNVIQKDRVIERMEGHSKRAKWLDESKVFSEEKGFVYVLGQSKSQAANVNMSMLYRIAESNAKVSLASSIEQKLTYIFQNAEEGLDVNSNQLKYVATESANVAFSSFKTINRYWEKVLSTVDAQGTQELNYLVFVRMQISESDLKKAVNDTMNKKNKGISEEFKKQVNTQWDKVANEQ